MEILTWIDKPVIVLLNQMGEILPREEENKEVQLWKDFLSNYKFIVAVLPLDAFARCWAQEYELWDEIGKALPPEQQAAFTSLKATWVRQNRLFTPALWMPWPDIWSNSATIKKFLQHSPWLKDLERLAELLVSSKKIFMVKFRTLK